ncbi:pantoate--beta-alanine ligase [Suttonella sp. R2A3]|uniref:pantoate--beta-alanine ligase n=1 Tax=Suttonella sp. R2A3 TaxID=2908648 RepID=UPI001F3F4894|nr:pantoate--beta-alanine ligase [Suttonella sp. R2A3]UJF25121.1 pantoate--beta-alanine ligase [Suttonella sp. R2A3]
MRVIKDLKSLNEWKLNQRDAGASWTLVPTMGNLHDGHLSLVDEALTVTDCVMASVYVNPTQFGVNEDLDSYPRTPKEDIEKLEAAGIAAVFMPDDGLIYPFGKDNAIGFTLPDVFTKILCGVNRPTHFQGVAAVVSRLFHLVEPKYAVFGLKDFQQQWIIRRLVADLHIPVEIVGAETVRAEDGLAMSSRNQYLSTTERAIAPVLHSTLQQSQLAISAGEDIERTLRQAKERLTQKGFVVDYLELRQQSDLMPATDICEPVVLLVAAKLGRTRLIDNIQFTN